MGWRDLAVSNSIYNAVFDDRHGKTSRIARILAFFSFFNVTLARYQSALFKRLRTEIWEIDDDEYRESFSRKDKHGKTARLNPVGDLGYSGSTFFATANTKFLIKSLPRRSEWEFFQDELLKPYFDHMSRHPSSMLVRIVDFLHAPYLSIGRILGIVPSHHIVMENVLYGKLEDYKHSERWETYDLKPSTYFYPERDIAGGHLASDSVKDRLIDEFKDKIRVSSRERDDLVEAVAQDTKLLESCNTTDYSLFLVRYPAPVGADEREVTQLQSVSGGVWRRGVQSADHKWVYRAILLDFFWAKHTLHAKAMTGLIHSYNTFDDHGPMSITTSPPEYRSRFLRMVEDLFEVQSEG